MKNKLLYNYLSVVFILLGGLGVSGCRSSRSNGERLWEAMEVIPPAEMPLEVKDAGFEVISDDDIADFNVATSSLNSVPATGTVYLVKPDDVNEVEVEAEKATSEKSVNVSGSNLIFDTDFKPVLGTYYYKVSWRGIGVGDAAVKIGLDGGMHTMEIRAGTGRKLDYLYKVRYRGKSKMMVSPEVASVEAEIDAKVKNRERKTELRFNDTGDVDFKMTKKKEGRVRGVKDMKIKAEGFVLDPFSAACLVRRLEWKIGTEAVFDVITGSKIYELRLACTKTARIKVNGKKRRAWVIVPVVKERETDGEKINKEHEDNVNKSLVEIYVAMDGSKDILRIEGHHKVGTIKAEIKKFKPAVQNEK